MALLLMFSAPSGWAAAVDMGEPFPEVQLQQPVSQVAKDYLGLAAGEGFTLSQIKGEVVLVELLNVLCPHCRKQTGPYNDLFQMIEEDPQTRGRIKLVGVAVANSDAQIEDFVDVYGVLYPVIPDYDFTVHRAVRGGQTPLSIYVRQDRPGQPGMVAGHHLGEDHDMPVLFAYLKDLLGMRPADFDGLAEPVPEMLDPDPPLPPDQLAEIAEKAFVKLGTTTDFKTLQLDIRYPVYAAKVKGRKLFAAVVSRSAICDVCHNVHYLVLFDGDGKLQAFEAIHLTSYGNVDWTEPQVQQMRKRVVGGRLGDAWEFAPDVDAVSSATMTSAIIFDSLRHGGELLQALERAGLR